MVSPLVGDQTAALTSVWVGLSKEGRSPTEAAIEIMEEPVAEWQKEESLKRLAEMKADPLSA